MYDCNRVYKVYMWSVNMEKQVCIGAIETNGRTYLITTYCIKTIHFFVAMVDKASGLNALPDVSSLFSSGSVL